jgi:preprotein translocase SecE subunit
MAVAVKNSPETASSPMMDRLPVWSLLGVLYVLAGIGVIFYLYPALWWSEITKATGALGSFGDFTLFLLGMSGLGAGFIVLGKHLLGSQPPHGLKAGIFMGLVGVVAVALLTRWVGVTLEGAVARGWFSAPIGMAITVLVGAALCVGMALWFVKPGFERLLVRFEDQGWFSAEGYKKSQGQRVRRGTILGILAMAGPGIYILHNTLGRGGDNHWFLRIPFTSPEVKLLILPTVQFSLPLILTGLALWFAYRVVNFPVFADFLIATEAELNKVSWTTRKRLFQDTIVVLTTVILMTVFLFLVDALWSYALSSRWIGVLKAPDPNAAQLDEQELSW